MRAVSNSSSSDSAHDQMNERAKPGVGSRYHVHGSNRRNINLSASELSASLH